MTEIDVKTESHNSASSTGKVTLPPINVGLSYPLSLQYHTTVGPEFNGQREVSLQVFLGSYPGTQKHNLGACLMVPNGPAISLQPTTIHYTPAETQPFGFYANEFTPNLSIRLEDHSGRMSVIISGDMTLKWTIGAIDMELLDPPY